MKEFIFLFTSPIKKMVFAETIKWRIKKDYSHVATLVYTGIDDLYDIHHAAHGMVHTVELNNFLIKNKIVEAFKVDCSEIEFTKAISYMKKQGGKDYSQLAAIASTFPCMRDLGIGKDNDRKFICSEYSSRILAVLKGFNFKYPPDYITPDMFETMILKHGKKLSMKELVDKISVVV